MCFKQLHLERTTCSITPPKKPKLKMHERHPEGGRESFQNWLWNSRNLGLPFLSAWGTACYKDISSNPEDPRITFPAWINRCCLWAEKMSLVYDFNYNDTVPHKLNMNLRYLLKGFLNTLLPIDYSHLLVLVSFKNAKNTLITFLVLIFHTRICC